MLAVHRKSKSPRDSVHPHVLTANSANILVVLVCSEDPFNCFLFFPPSNSFAVCRSAIWSLLDPFLCEKRWVHHRWQQLVQLCKPMESQGLFCHWQAQSAHVSHNFSSLFFHIGRNCNLVFAEFCFWVCSLAGCVCFQGSCKWRCVCCTAFPWGEDHGLRHPRNQWTDSQASATSKQRHTWSEHSSLHANVCQSVWWVYCSFQPIHNMGSSGYGSHGSNGSHEQQVSISSSSESNGNAGRTTEETGKAKPTRTFQEICKGVHMLKNQDSQAGLPSPSPSPSPAPSKLEQKKTSDSETTLSLMLFL